MINITNECNMALMARYPDNYFDLAIVDPPYGIGINANMGLKKGQKKKHEKVNWDNETPSDEYWKEVFRVSKNQIVWGANYFPQVWVNGCKHFIFWDKETPLGMSFSDGELAFTSFDRADRKFTFRNVTGDKIHPTQKPVKLYEWLLMNYAKEGDKILDTHLGSGSIAIACHNLKFDLTACELDTDYFDASLKRLHNHQSQLTMF
jgi:site-specific DNA-methyltransferase (adenine-specific)